MCSKSKLEAAVITTSILYYLAFHVVISLHTLPHIPTPSTIQFQYKVDGNCRLAKSKYNLVTNWIIKWMFWCKVHPIQCLFLKLWQFIWRVYRMSPIPRVNLRHSQNLAYSWTFQLIAIEYILCLWLIRWVVVLSCLGTQYATKSGIIPI